MLQIKFARNPACGPKTCSYTGIAGRHDCIWSKAMKLHFFSPAHTSQRPTPQHNENFKYATMFIIGVPSVVFGSMYFVDLAFELLWH